MIGCMSFTSRKAYLRCSGNGFNLISGGCSFEGGILVEGTKATTYSFVVVCLDSSNLSPISGSRHSIKVCLLIISSMDS